MTRPELFYDLGSPYAYLAVERAERVLGVPTLRIDGRLVYGDDRLEAAAYRG